MPGPVRDRHLPLRRDCPGRSALPRDVGPRGRNRIARLGQRPWDVWRKLRRRHRRLRRRYFLGLLRGRAEPRAVVRYITYGYMAALTAFLRKLVFDLLDRIRRVSLAGIPDAVPYKY